jgi:hypothetical protein
MPRPKKTLVDNPTVPPGSNVAGEVPTIRWLSLVKTKGGYAVLAASSAGREIQEVEVLHGPLGRAAASAALRTEMARAYLVGKGPQ